MTLYEIAGVWSLIPAILGFVILVFCAGANSNKPDLYSGDDDEFF